MYNNNNDLHASNVQWDGNSYATTNYRVEDTPGASSPTPPNPKKPRKNGAAKAVALVLCCALLGGGAGVGGAALYDTISSSNGGTTTVLENNTVPSTTVNVQQADGVNEMSLSEIYAAYVNSSVVITAQVAYSTNTWFGPSSSTATSAGSGFVISDNGYIVTNYHVIDGAQSIKVTFYDGSEYEATYVGGEESNDVAVLKIDAEGRTPVVLGDSDTLAVGQQVSTIGNALGTLSFSQTSGYVSGLGRSVTYSDGTVINMIQTDCTINSGNSGGPLFDQYGRVVGITSAKYSGSSSSSGASIENIGFAIPINDVKSIITDIMEHGYVVRPSMGITVATVTEEFSQYFNWPLGAYVNSVEAGSCAETAGLKQGDIITAIGDTQVTTHNELIAAKNTYAPGDTAQLTVYRAGETLTLTITFDEEKQDVSTSDPAPETTSSQQGGYGGGHDSNGYYYPFGF